MIKFFDFKREYSKLKDEINVKIDEVLSNGNFIRWK